MYALAYLFLSVYIVISLIIIGTAPSSLIFAHAGNVCDSHWITSIDYVILRQSLDYVILHHVVLGEVLGEGKHRNSKRVLYCFKDGITKDIEIVLYSETALYSVFIYSFVSYGQYWIGTVQKMGNVGK